jgi:glycosyltransferase involved in cell wall biosynthesis
MTTVSVIMPVYNVETYVREAVESVLSQSFTDFELIIVDDGSGDESIAICEQFDDQRIKIVSQKNRGLSGARNTGIWHSVGRYIALLDSDDRWYPDKLKLHLEHLEANPAIGVSYCPSEMIDANGDSIGLCQTPKLSQITARDVFCRNPVGNGSAPVLRRAALEQIAFVVSEDDTERTCYFDEAFRYSEDIECWMRIALTTEWKFEGIPQMLTQYRIVTGGLSANTRKMHEFWQKMYDKVQIVDAQFAEKHGPRAYAYQRRYYARRAVMEGASVDARWHLWAATRSYPTIYIEETTRSMVTLAAVVAVNILPLGLLTHLKVLLLNLKSGGHWYGQKFSTS